MKTDPFADVRDARIGGLTEEQKRRVSEMWLRGNLLAFPENEQRLFEALFLIIDDLRAMVPEGRLVESSDIDDALALFDLAIGAAALVGPSIREGSTAVDVIHAKTLVNARAQIRFLVARLSSSQADAMAFRTMVERRLTVKFGSAGRFSVGRDINQWLNKTTDAELSPDRPVASVRECINAVGAKR